MNIHAPTIFLFACFGLSTVSAAPAVNIYFEKMEYRIFPGEAFELRVFIDPVPAEGLVSYAIKLTLDRAKARLDEITSVTVPAPLDFNGVAGAGALIQAGEDFAGVKGTVDFFRDPLQSYEGALLATFRLRDLGATNSYQIGLEFFNTLGPTESLFVNGSGSVLDPDILFHTATIIVPEPRTVSLLAAGIAAVWFRGFRKKFC